MAPIEFLLVFCLACAAVECNYVSEHEFQEIVAVVKRLGIENVELKQKVAMLMSEKLQKEEIELKFTELVQNITIEERVSLLEIQVADIEVDVNELDENVDFLFEEQVIQDERLQDLEQSDVQINQILFQVDEDIEDLQDTALALDFRVTILEENGGGGGGNSSVAELEERVETLEGTAAEHETRLTTTEENIEALQMTDISHDARITALEENGGGSDETIAFNAVLTNYSTMVTGDTVLFNQVLTNEGNGYNSDTGVFTVPSGGDGFYYFSTYLLVDTGNYAYLDMLVNGEMICGAVGDDNGGEDNDLSQGSCSAVVSLAEGDQVRVEFRDGDDTTPLFAAPIYFWNGFTGFKI